ncbi:unnamed protein product [Leptidea sinapis]|uniref:Uncharacterized protein n=1 Tax=Leptidea sinapis TaxID=189913 RepID=A0A5E4PZ19_9NEOP|nr:unnamed protein product [Leptidea sinapis]
MMTMDIGMYNNQQNGYNAEYYQQNGYQAPYEGYHEGYYEPGHYYEPVAGPPPQEPAPVISTDTGLCYTNLDYGELQHGYPLAPPTSHIPHQPRPEELHLHEHKIDNHYLESKYNMHFVDDSSLQYSHGSPLACGDFEVYTPKEEFGVLREGFPREDLQGHQLTHHQPHHSHTAVPTYKWMQVKRNVPKPSGEC